MLYTGIGCSIGSLAGAPVSLFQRRTVWSSTRIQNRLSTLETAIWCLNSPRHCACHCASRRPLLALYEYVQPSAQTTMTRWPSELNDAKPGAPFVKVISRFAVRALQIFASPSSEQV